MRFTGDGFIKLGFFAQLVFLGLVDWGTLHAFAHMELVPWYHWAGFLAVNAGLVGMSVLVWAKWMAAVRSLPPVRSAGDRG